MDSAAFVEKWARSTRSEKSAAQEHFLDLCELLQHPKPGDVDSKGYMFTTEAFVKKAGGGHGFADVVKRGFFAWEYKKKGADLNAAFNQLLQYSGDLGNPPLLIASDMDRIEIRYFLGVLHSRVHEVWARSQGTQVRERESGFRYTPTSCFETFPFLDLNLERSETGEPPGEEVEEESSSE